MAHDGPPATQDEMRDRLAEAASTLRRLPGGKEMRWLRGEGNSMPTPIRDSRESYGWDRATFTRLGVGLHDVSRMDEALRWLREVLSVEQARTRGLVPDSLVVVWGRASRWPWTRIGEQRRALAGLAPGQSGLRLAGGNSKPSLEKIEVGGLNALLAHLGSAEGPGVEERRQDARMLALAGIELQTTPLLRYRVDAATGALERVLTSHARTRLARPRK